MNIEDIKNWIEEVIDLIENSRDTDDRWQKETRRLWGKAFRRRLEVKEWVLVNKPNALSHLVELKDYMEDYWKYFKKGYQPTNTIDELPTLILNKALFIREGIDKL